MFIIDITESAFHKLQLERVHLYLSYFVIVVVGLLQSYLIENGHLIVAGRWIVVRILNWNGRDEVFADPYHFFFILIVVDALIIRDEQGIRMWNLNSRSQQIPKSTINVVFVLKV